MTDNDYEILKIRAKELSKPLASEQNSKDLISIIKFRLNDEIYAFDISYLQEMVNKKDITKVPLSPPFILGIIILRGVVYSINNLCIILNIENSIDDNNGTIFIARSEEVYFGFLVNEVIGEFLVNKNLLEIPTASLDIQNKEYLKGVFSDGTIYLNIQKILNDKKLIVE